MAEQKTKPTDESAVEYLNKIMDETKRKDAFTIFELMSNVSKEKPKMWGGSIVGFGGYHYKYASGHEGTAPVIGFSPRKTSLSLYLMLMENHSDLLKKLGKHKTGKGCLYINKLSDVDINVLKILIDKSNKSMLKHIKDSKWELSYE